MECNTCHAEIPDFAGRCPQCGAQLPIDNARFTRLKNIFSVRYDFLRLLGIGGFAEVYLARDKLLEREVAIKILLPQHSLDAQTVERFLREARLYAKLEHKNIIPIYDTGILEQHVFITMKYVRGESLKHILFTQKRIPPGLLPGIIRGVAQALSYIHQQGIVHRDIKPANIILEKSSQAVYLADFGIARSESSQTLTQTGMIVGTPFYLSPEQIKGKKIDPRSDIYALGATLYELATGEPPFRGDSPLEILYQHVNENAKSLVKTVPNIDPVVERIISKCIEKDPARRYQKADEIVAVLDEAPEPLTGPFEKTVLTSTVRSRPGRAWKIVAAAALLSALAGTAYFLWVRDSHPQPGAAKQPLVSIAQTAGDKPELDKNSAKEQARLSRPQSSDPASGQEEKPAPIPSGKSGIARQDFPQVKAEKTGPHDPAARIAPATLSGSVRFSSFPAMADIYFQGEKIGSTEQVFAREFPAGAYIFSFVIPDYQSAEVRVTVPAGETISAHYRFPPFRSFTITARPFGRVFVDGREYGDTPQVIKLAYGEHLVRLAKNGYRSEERKITVAASAKNSIFIELSKEDKR